MTEKINRTDELLEMVLENQVTEIGYLKSIRTYIGFFALIVILGLILGFCSSVL